MKRREFLKGLGLTSLWIVSPKAKFRATPRVETEPPVEQLVTQPEEQSAPYSNMYFCAGTSLDDMPGTW